MSKSASTSVSILPQPGLGRLLPTPPRLRQAAQTGPRRHRAQTRRPRRLPPPCEPPLAALRALRTGARMTPTHFRAFMEFTFDVQQGCLGSRDLVPFVGSRARVSEVLSGRRQITMSLGPHPPREPRHCIGVTARLADDPYYLGPRRFKASRAGPVLVSDSRSRGQIDPFVGSSPKGADPHRRKTQWPT